MTHQAGEFISSKSAVEEHPEWKARVGKRQKCRQRKEGMGAMLEQWMEGHHPQFIVSFIPRAFCPSLDAIWAQGEFSHLPSLVFFSHTWFPV